MEMNRRKILQGIGSKLKKLRKQLNYSRPKMAACFGVSMTGYGKNERGDTLPKLGTLIRLAEDFDISLDWLIMNKGTMYYKEKEPEKLIEKETKEKTASLEDVMPGVRELLDSMAQDPLLLHEVMVYFYKYKEKKESQQTLPNPSTHERTGT
ncbi:MAG: helix-turn-helix transcriptional regulator [Candidatus Aminicenantes bacterium]|nr:MAG: helix-turn-helix transcriptional regulator [Candidatus Aminicenantes bacterium]